MSFQSSWIESNYFKSLNKEDEARYKSKLTLSDGPMLPDPDTLDDWKNDVTLLPDVNWPEVYNYLINMNVSNYTDESLKAYKSLYTYNFF